MAVYMILDKPKQRDELISLSTFNEDFSSWDSKSTKDGARQISKQFIIMYC